MKKILILLGAIALTFTLATAEGKCDTGNKAEMKCNSGKCGESNKTKKCDTGKCNGDKKEAPAKGKCGQGKCG